MTMWKLKSCPRCGGDLFIAQDAYGWYEQCLQCSHRSDLKELTDFKKQSGSGAGTPSKKEVTAVSGSQ